MLGVRIRGDALKLAIAVALVFLLAAPVGLHFWRSQEKMTTPVNYPSIAVLPFVDLSPEKDHEYFSDGLTEELINDLAQVPGLKVVARSSSFQFKGKDEDLRKVGSKLGVANILEGSIRREGDRVRIRAELTKADDGFQLWSETYDRKINDIFTVQDEIARSATRALQVKRLGDTDATAATSERSANAEAYEAYLRARYFTTRGRDKADLDNALTYTEQAIKLDPKVCTCLGAQVVHSGHDGRCWADGAGNSVPEGARGCRTCD